MPRITILFVASAVAFTSPVHAQGDAYVELYGDGVHKFYAGDLNAANELLTRVIESGSQDPRAYYFRGLVLEYQAPDSGTADFQTGAELEATGRRVVDVPTALTRIQGHLRTKIEVARRDARIRAEEERQQQQRPRVESRPPSELPPSPETTTPPPTEEDAETPPAPDEVDDETDPFSDGGLRSEEATPDEEQPAAPDVTDIPDPFADDQPGDAPAEPSAEPPPEQTDPVDPFGSQNDDSGEDEPSDPFGDDPFEGL